MSREGYRVFSDGEIAGLSTKNRLMRSGTYEGAMTGKGKFTPLMGEIYRRLAEGGSGIIATGIMSVSSNGVSMPRQTVIYDDRLVSEIAPIADAVHRYGDGCKVIAQMAHAGRQVFLENRKGKCLGPSAVPCPILKRKPRALSTGEIQAVVQSFADGIRRSKEAGFDGAQLHAAHGYLLSSFLSPHTNRRTDDYGGSAENRFRIIEEIISTAREEVGDFPILIKVNSDDNVPGGITPREFPELAGRIQAAGYDAIEVSGSMWDCLVRSEEELGFPPVPLPEAHTDIGGTGGQSYFLPNLDEIDLSIPVILVGGNRNVERLEEIIEAGKVDFFSFARPLVAEPDLPRRWLEGRGSDSCKCISCNACLFDLKFGSVRCNFQQSQLKYRMMRKYFTRYWRLAFM